MIYLFYTLQISVKLGSKLDQKLTTFTIFWPHARTELLELVLEPIKCSPPRNFALAKFLWPWKLQQQILFLSAFSDQTITVCQISFEIFNVKKNWYLSKKVNIWASSGYFLFSFIFLLEWNKQEIFRRRHKKDQKQSPQPATLLKRDFAPGVFQWILQNFQE